VFALIFALGVGSAPIAAKSPSCTAAHAQAQIDGGRYDLALREFTCVIDADPTGVEGYRGRIEAELLLGHYSDSVRDYARVTAFVEPVHPDAQNTILGGYAARLKLAPDALPALTGMSFARWWYFDYTGAIHVLNRLVQIRPGDVFANLFRGSSRLLQGVSHDDGVIDIERALTLDPLNAHVRYVVADAYTYGLADPERAFSEATLALQWGLDTPRIHAILANAYFAFGDQPAAAAEIAEHFELVTTELIQTTALAAGTSLALNLVPGRSFEVPITVSAGQTLSIATSSPSKEIYDSIAVLLAADGTPMIGADDANKYFAAFKWTAPASGTYRLWVTSFESVNTGELVVARD
jgi:tetratricopeptide (TPR) repeat protein